MSNSQGVFLSGVEDLVLLLGGFQVVTIGLLSWIAKLWLSSSLEKIRAKNEAMGRELQAHLDKNLHVHKLQFEKELRIYEAIWAALVDVRSDVLQLRPKHDTVDENESEDERRRRRLSNATDSFNLFWDQVNKERPFYDESVFAELQDLLGLMRGEMIDYGIFTKHDTHYWKQAEENADAIVKKVDGICEAI